MRRAGFALCCIVLSLSACAGGKKPAAGNLPPSPTPAPASRPEPSPVPTPAVSAREVAGGWGRTITAGVSWNEGIVLAPDGRLGLLGIYSMDGVAWRLDGTALVLATNTERYPDPVESRLFVVEGSSNRLVLSGTDYLAGAWERREFAAVTGTVTYRQRIALTPEAIVQVELRDVSREDVEAPLLAKRVIRKPGQVPVAFVLDYDPAALVPGRACAISARITDRGQLQFVTDVRIPVITNGAPTSAEIVVVPVR